MRGISHYDFFPFHVSVYSIGAYGLDTIVKFLVYAVGGMMPLVFQYLCPDWCTICSERWNELRHGYIHVGSNISACSMICELIEVSLRGCFPPYRELWLTHVTYQ